MSEPGIRVSDVSKAFGGKTVLQDFDLEVAEKETVAVLGRSGTGKSVLLKLIIGLLEPDAGSIRIQGKEIVGLGDAELNGLRKKVGFLFQSSALYDSLTVEENVAFPLARHSPAPASEQKQRVRDLLEQVGLDKDAAKLPSEISGGMQKRVSLARALALDPSILLLDEPTAGLDPITAEEIARLIQDLKKKHSLAAVLVTHDVPTARAVADRLVLMKDGRVFAQGTFDELRRNKDPFVTGFVGEPN